MADAAFLHRGVRRLEVISVLLRVVGWLEPVPALARQPLLRHPDQTRLLDASPELSHRGCLRAESASAYLRVGAYAHGEGLSHGLRATSAGTGGPRRHRHTERGEE